MFKSYADCGLLTAGEIQRRMREYPDMEFQLVLDDPEPGEAGDTWAADSPELWSYNPEQVPTDDNQRPLRLECRLRRASDA